MIVVTNTTEKVVISSTGTQGPAGINWRGDWQSGQSYALRDGVYRNGSSYRCIQAHEAAAANEPGVGIDWQDFWRYIAQGNPGIAVDHVNEVLVVTGQSNIARQDAYDWSNDVPGNLNLWNWSAVEGDQPSDIGTAWIKPDGSYITQALAIGADIARERPNAQIYVFDFSLGGMVIDNWGPSPPTIDFRLAMTNNIPAGLALLPAGAYRWSRWWWQGESDGLAGPGRADYIKFFEENVAAWWEDQDWWPGDTPTYMFGFSPYVDIGGGDLRLKNYTSTIIGCVADRPDTRRFIDVSGFPIALWNAMDTTQYIHTTAEGKFAIGTFAALHHLYGYGEPVEKNTVRNLVTGTRVRGTDADGYSFSAFGGQFTARIDEARTDTAGTVAGGVSNLSNDPAAVAQNGAYSAGGAYIMSMSQNGTHQLIGTGAGLAVDLQINPASGFERQIAFVRYHRHTAEGYTLRLSATLPPWLANEEIAITWPDTATDDLILITGRRGGVNREHKLWLGEALDGDATPALTIEANLDGLTAAGASQHWFRVGDMVTVFGHVAADPTAPNVNTQWRMSLPVASDLTSVADLAGTFHNGANASGMIAADPANNEARFFMVTPATANLNLWYHFSYKVLS